LPDQLFPIVIVTENPHQMVIGKGIEFSHTQSTSAKYNHA